MAYIVMMLSLVLQEEYPACRYPAVVP